MGGKVVALLAVAVLAFTAASVTAAVPRLPITLEQGQRVAVRYGRANAAPDTRVSAEDCHLRARTIDQVVCTLVLESMDGPPASERDEWFHLVVRRVAHGYTARLNGAAAWHTR